MSAGATAGPRTAADRSSLRSPLLPIAAIIGAALIWSTSFAVTKVALERIPPMTIGAIRFAIAALLLAAAVRLQKTWRPASRPAALAMGGAGLLGITLYFGLENVGVDLATASDAAVIVAAFPVITLLIEVLFQHGRASVSRVAGMLIAMAGVWLIFRQSAGTSGSDRLWGDLILLAAGVAWAAYNVVARRTSVGQAPLTSTYYQTIAGAGGFLVLTPVEAGQWRSPAPVDLVILAFLATMCSVAAFFLYNYGLREVSASTAVNLLNLVPVFGLVAAVVVTGEHVGATEVAGCIVVITGVVLGTGVVAHTGARRRMRRTAAEPPTIHRPAGEHVDQYEPDGPDDERRGPRDRGRRPESQAGA